MEEFSISDLRDDRFTMENLKGFASEILELFEKKNVNSRASLEKIVGETFDAIRGKIHVKKNPELGERVYVISYVIPGRGTPIKIDIDLDHYSVIVECSKEVEGYGSLEENPLGNIIQEKRLNRSWRYIRGELEYFEGLKPSNS